MKYHKSKAGLTWNDVATGVEIQSIGTHVPEPLEGRELRMMSLRPSRAQKLRTRSLSFQLILAIMWQYSMARPASQFSTMQRPWLGSVLSTRSFNWVAL